MSLGPPHPATRRGVVDRKEETARGEAQQNATYSAKLGRETVLRNTADGKLYHNIGEAGDVWGALF